MTKCYLATSMACVFVIHAPAPELPMVLIKGDSKSWAERHKGRLSKKDRRK